MTKTKGMTQMGEEKINKRDEDEGELICLCSTIRYYDKVGKTKGNIAQSSNRTDTVNRTVDDE